MRTGTLDTKQAKKKKDEVLLSDYYVSLDNRYNFYRDKEAENKLLIMDIHTPDLETIIHYDLNNLPEFNLDNLDENIVVHLVYDLGNNQDYRGQQLDINTDMKKDGTIDMEQYVLDYVFNTDGSKNFSGSTYGLVKRVFNNNAEFKIYLEELISKYC